MSTIEAGRSTYLHNFYPTEPATGAASDDSLVTAGQNEGEVVRKAWNTLIDSKLIEWGRDPSLLEDDELIPPSRAAIQRAVDLAIRLRDEEKLPAPKRVVPDGDGGVVFERWEGEISESFEISESGGIEYVLCRNGSVAERRIVL